MTGATVPPARQPEPQPLPDDALADAIALAECYSRDDTEAIAAILVNCELAEVTLVLAKLLAEEHGPCGCIEDGSFRSWAIEAGSA
jgi:hypothetical protein